MRAEVVAIALRSAPHGLVVEAFDPSSVYQLTDDDPHLLMAVSGTKKPRYEKGTKGINRGISEAKADLPTIGGARWWRVKLVSDGDLSAHRPLGYGQRRLEYPETRIDYYLWPQRLFDRDSWLAMVADIELETGVCPWSRTESTRVAVGRAAAGGTRDARRLLDDIGGELQTANWLIRAPYSEVWADGKAPDLPENRLVLRWARRRLPVVEDIAERAIAHRTRLEDEADSVQGNRSRVKDVGKLLRRRVEEQHRAIRLAAGIRRICLRSFTDDGGLTITPAMLRDHRLRKLLGALRPTPRETIETVLASRSTLPPLKTTKLFELWGVVWLARHLRSLGWDGPQPECMGADGHQFSADLYRARWRLRRGSVRLTLDWSLDPKVVEPPAASSRVKPALQWSADEIRKGSTSEALYTTRPKSPDYILRLVGPSGRALGIGDASLADPQFQKGMKIDKISQYRREVAWLPQDEPNHIACAPLGLFALLPRTHFEWSDPLRLSAAATDCHLITVAPGRPSPTDAMGVDRLIGYLVGKVR